MLMCLHVELNVEFGLNPVCEVISLLCDININCGVK